jgi:hypothetical protein
VGKYRRGGYVFITWKGDHPPRHVHVYRDGKLIVKWDLDNQKPMKGSATRRILELISELEAEGCCENPFCQAQQSEESVRGRHVDEETRVPVLEGGAGAHR